MSWDAGKQERRKKYSMQGVLDEIEELGDEYLSEEDATSLFYKYLRANVNITSELMTGVRLYPFQEMAIKTMMISDYTMCVWSRGLSKCPKINELCMTDRGLVRVKDVKIGEKIQSLNNMNIVEDKTINPKQKTWTAKTFAGYSSGGLDYHRALVFNPETCDFDWKFAKDMKAGDIIPIRKGYNCWGKFNDIRDLSEKFEGKFSFDAHKRSVKDWYYFFGLLIGDGHWEGSKLKKGGAGFTSDDYELAKWGSDFVCDVCCKDRVEPTREKSSNCYRINFSRSSFIKWVNNLGFNTLKKAKDKKIPEFLMNNSKENLCALLSGLYDTDGYVAVSENKKKKSVGAQVGFTSASEELILQVQMLLLNLGIETSTAMTFKGGESDFGGKKYICNKAWSILICNNTTLRQFNEHIGFKLSRKQSLLEDCFSRQTHGENGYNIQVPCSRFIRENIGKCFSINGIKHKVGKEYKSISKQKLEKVYESGRGSEQDREKIKKVLDLDIYYDVVKEVVEGEDYTVDLQVANEHNYISNGFVVHNTFSTAMFCILEMLFNQKARIGVLSSNFRQAKMILQKMDEIIDTEGSKLLKDCKPNLQRGTDQWTYTIGKASVTALPLAGGDRLRGFRFNIIVIDEFLLIPDKIFNEVIMPFLGVCDNPTQRDDIQESEDYLIQEGLMEEKDRYIWPNNKLVLLSSPSYKFEYMYKLYCKYEALIFGEDPSQKGFDGMEEVADDVDGAHRAILHLSYDCAPEKLYDKNLLAQSKATMSENQFKREFGAQFIDESDGYYKLSKMVACTIQDGISPTVEIKGEPDSEYILAFDPSWSNNSSSDNFAIHLGKLDKHMETVTIVHSYAVAGFDIGKHIKYFHYLLTHFNIVSMVGDIMGGQQFIQSCNESATFQDAGMSIKVLEEEIKFDNPEDEEKDYRRLKNSHECSNKKKTIFLRKPSSSWIREANEGLQSAIDNRRVYFASRAIDASMDDQMSKKIPAMSQISFANREMPVGDSAMKLEFIDQQKENIENTKIECSNIQITTSPQGHQKFDLAPELKRQTGPNRQRKDSYSALVLLNWWATIYFNMVNGNKKTTTKTFEPFFA